MKRFHLLLTLSFFLSVAEAQTISGSWFGKADINNGNGFNNYLIELIIKENGNQIQGIIGYYFKNTYQSFIVKGSYNKDSREVIIKNVPILNYNSTGDDDLECPMNFSGAVIISKVKSSIIGYFYASDALKYKCPDLKVNLQRDENDHSSENLANLRGGEKKVWKSTFTPPTTNPVSTAAVSTNPVPLAAPTTKTSENKPIQSSNKPATGSAKTEELKKEEPKPAPKTEPIVPNQVSAPPPSPAIVAGPTPEEKRALEVFEKRSNNYLSDLEVISDSIRISFYDNGEVDGDTISVFINKIPVIIQKGISTRALTAYIKLDPSKPVNELSMLAENLGKYPPNTALMVLSDGYNTYEVYLSSSFTQNATVRLKRKKK